MPNGKYTLRKNENRIQELDIKYGTLIADLLIHRGIKDLETARRHLTGNLEEEHGDPFSIPDMKKALDRIYTAIQKNENIVIHADYDCDGIPGAVILSTLFNTINFKNYIVSIPDRNTEGYGLHAEHVEKFKNKGAHLIITIDMGISAIDSTDLANTYNIDVIITDHHTIPTIVPNSHSIIHPKIFGSTYSNPELCGAGVVYTLVRGFIDLYGQEFNITNDFLKKVVDMAAFATLSDMVELTTENKAIVKEGLSKIRNSPRAGLMALAKKSRVYLKDLTQDDITFMLAPKLNVASRMGSPYDAYNLLMEENRENAEIEAEKLVNLSNERRKIVALMVKEARREIAQWGKDEKSVIVIGHPSWKVGLLGLVASKIVELYDKPVFVWGRSEKEDSIVYKGSCRGNGTISVYEIMKNVDAGVLSEYGGHFEAGGFAVEAENIYNIEESLIKAKDKLDNEINAITISEKCIDAILPVSLLHINLHRAISRLAPFGPGNEEPVFAFKNATILDIRTFGTLGAHIEITFRDKSLETASAYAFYTKAEDVGNPQIGQQVHIIGTLDSKLWQSTVRIRLKDIVTNF